MTPLVWKHSQNIKTCNERKYFYQTTCGQMTIFFWSVITQRQKTKNQLSAWTGSTLTCAPCGFCNVKAKSMRHFITLFRLMKQLHYCRQSLPTGQCTVVYSNTVTYLYSFWKRRPSALTQNGLDPLSSLAEGQAMIDDTVNTCCPNFIWNLSSNFSSCCSSSTTHADSSNRPPVPLASVIQACKRQHGGGSV